MKLFERCPNCRELIFPFQRQVKGLLGTYHLKCFKTESNIREEFANQNKSEEKK